MLTDSDILDLASEFITSPDQKAPTIRGKEDLIAFARAILGAEVLQCRRVIKDSTGRAAEIRVLHPSNGG